MNWHKHDPVMRKLVRRLPEPTPYAAKEDLYLALLDSVMGQQLSIKAADTIFGRFLDLFPDRYPDATLLLQMPDDTIRKAGLSGAKLSYARNIARFHLDTPITVQRLGGLTDEQILAELTTIKGVGTWTVQMLLMFAMNRPDVFSPGDLIIRQMMVRHYGLTETGRALMDRLHGIAEGWKPHRTLACRYLWHGHAAERAEARATTLKTKTK